MKVVVLYTMAQNVGRLSKESGEVERIYCGDIVLIRLGTIVLYITPRVTLTSAGNGFITCTRDICQVF